MKKFTLILCLVLMLFGLILPAFAEHLVCSKKEYVADLAKVSSIGTRLLNSNGIEKRMVFVLKNDFKNNYIRMSDRNRQITLTLGLYMMLSSEDEVAAVLGGEISHALDSYNGIMRGYFSSVNTFFVPKKYVYKADLRAVDFMVNAGYNPLAEIVVLSKIKPQTRYDWYAKEPLTSRRMMRIYEYIYQKYPEYLVDNKYKDNIYYQNFLLTSRVNRQKFQDKVRTKSVNAVKYQ